MTNITIDDYGNVTELKTCSKCLRAKELSEFNKGAIFQTLRASCKECDREYQRKRRKK